MTETSTAALATASAPQMPGRPDSRMAVLDIDLTALVANWHALHAAHGGRPTAAVVKADAYGTGALRVGPALYAAGCRHFFTAHLDEAQALRPLLPGALLAPLNGLLPGSEAEHLTAGITPVLSSVDEVLAWAALGRHTGRALPAILHIDSGLARRGLSPAEATALWAAPDRVSGLALRYAMTHLAAADVPADEGNVAQLEQFEAVCRALPLCRRSVANSAALFLDARFRSDLARPGAALYGINPTRGQPNPMRPVVRLRAQVLQVREVLAGACVGYNATWRAERHTRLAVIGVGYGDGWPRALSNRGAARFDGATLPLVGRVSMDLSTFDATDAPQLRPGHWLELIGAEQGVDQIAEQAGTSGYEILTNLGRRYARAWHG